MNALLAALRDWQRESRILTVAVWVHLGLLVGALLAMPFDHRLILGLNPWIKPSKFDVSVLVYLVTVAALLHLLGTQADGTRRWRRMRMLIAWVVGVSMIVENSIISMQSARGVRSHMNYTTLFDGIAFGIMGNFIALNTVAVALLLALWCVSRPERVPRVVQWAIRLGLCVFLAGSVEGVLMVVNSGHIVGAKDGVAGLPYVNWSTGHGDLRVPHFFALHALEALPLLGWALSYVRWPSWAQVTALCLASAGYLGAVWLMFRQAMAGRPWIG